MHLKISDKYLPMLFLMQLHAFRRCRVGVRGIEFKLIGHLKWQHSNNCLDHQSTYELRSDDAHETAIPLFVSFNLLKVIRVYN